MIENCVARREGVTVLQLGQGEYCDRYAVEHPKVVEKEVEQVEDGGLR